VGSAISAPAAAVADSPVGAPAKAHMTVNRTDGGIGVPRGLLRHTKVGPHLSWTPPREIFPGHLAYLIWRPPEGSRVGYPAKDGLANCVVVEKLGIFQTCPVNGFHNDHSDCDRQNKLPPVFWEIPLKLLIHFRSIHLDAPGQLSNAKSS